MGSSVERSKSDKKSKEIEKVQGLCHRCEHRVLSIETNGAWGPRMECRTSWSGDIFEDIENEYERYDRCCYIIKKEMYQAGTDKEIVNAIDGLLAIHRQHQEIIENLCRGGSKAACYMYKPVTPVVLYDYLGSRDPRPIGSGYMARRTCGKRLPTDKEYVLSLRKVGKREYLLCGEHVVK